MSDAIIYTLYAPIHYVIHPVFIIAEIFAGIFLGVMLYGVLPYYLIQKVYRRFRPAKTWDEEYAEIQEYRKKHGFD